MSRPLHIVCLDAPYPPDYGGAIDMYYKIKALAAIGMDIQLHYFDYRPERNSGAVSNYCRSVFAYKRRTGLAGLSLHQPYIVSSRINKHLIQRLNADNHPIILEGIHSTGIIPFLRKDRKITVRLHNDEQQYYYALAKYESNLFKKLYYYAESIWLQNYQSHLDPSCTYACLSEREADLFRHKYGLPHTAFIPCFIPWQQVQSVKGRGDYCLYHGNLSVSENEQGVLWLVQNIFSKMAVPFIIAGKKSSRILKQAIQPYRHITLIEHPSEQVLEQLVLQAHIHVLPFFNKTGVKLKLLHALFKGRFCLTNFSGAAGSGVVEGLLHVARTPKEFMEAISYLFTKEFTGKDICERNKLCTVYNNKQNAERLSAL